MNDLIIELAKLIANNAQSRLDEEQYLVDVQGAIAKGLDVQTSPSKILARIEYFKGRHDGLAAALDAIQIESKFGA
jgi:hypothetical protein